MSERIIAYFTMEIALEPGMPTYSGGLGGLAGDTVRSAADLRVPFVAISLLHRGGYFNQRVDEHGNQREEPVLWDPASYLEEMPARARVHIAEREVELRAWRYLVRGVSGHEVPVYFIDADLPANAAQDRALTGQLYGGDEQYRLCQEIVLGIGGVRMLRALGYHAIAKFHMNEGHAALLTVELLHEQLETEDAVEVNARHIETVRQKCVFTTHTPVPAGHDQFPMDLVAGVMGKSSTVLDCEDVFCVDVWKRIFRTDEVTHELQELVRRGIRLNMTYLALNLSSYVNGVARKHGEVSRLMFGDYPIDSITNGIHLGTWATPAFASLFDSHIPGWREDNFSVRYAIGIPAEDVWAAHSRSKSELIDFVRSATGVALDPEILTLGFARRAAAYKRADLLFADMERVRRISRAGGGLQVVYAGKAHPRDQPGKDLIRRVVEAGRRLDPEVKVVYLENYDTALARLIAGGVDVWLNTPKPPNEASGTSGMKAALNGVPNFSVLDGWWIEGHIEDVTGWAIGNGEGPGDRSADAALLYDKLERRIMPMYRGNRPRFIEIMRNAIALNGSFFNTQRMVQQYVVRAYLS